MAKKKTAVVEHSKRFELVKSYYDAKRWGKKAVYNAVGKGWITAAEYEEITGEKYE
jgi:predicted DNA-binding ArsR family transcriptional regulator